MPEDESDHKSDLGQGDSGWKPPQSQADLDRIVQDRLARAQRSWKESDEFKQLQSKASQMEALEQEMSSEADKRVREAQQAAEKAAREQYLPRVVGAELRAAVAGRGLDRERVNGLIEDANLARFVKDDGSVDEDRVAAWADRVAPAPQSPARTGPSAVGLGNHQASKQSAREQAAAQIEKRFGKK